MFCTLSELISLNIVPIINTNDAVSPPMFIVDDDLPVGSKKVLENKTKTFKLMTKLGCKFFKYVKVLMYVYDCFE